MSEWYWIPIAIFGAIGVMFLVGFIGYLWRESEYKSYRKEREAIYKQEAEAVKRFNEYQRTVNNEATD